MADNKPVTDQDLGLTEVVGGGSGVAKVQEEDRSVELQNTGAMLTDIQLERQQLKDSTDNFTTASRSQLQRDRDLSSQEQQLRLQVLGDDLRRDVPKKAGLGKKFLAAGASFFTGLGGGDANVGRVALQQKEDRRQGIIGHNQQMDFILERAGVELQGEGDRAVIQSFMDKIRNDEGARDQILKTMAENNIPITLPDGSQISADEARQQLAEGTQQNKTDGVMNQIAQIGGRFDDLDPSKPIDLSIMEKWQDVLHEADSQKKFDKANILLGAVARRNQLEEMKQERDIADSRALAANPPAPFESPAYRGALNNAAKLGVDMQDPKIKKIFESQPEGKNSNEFFRAAPGRLGSFIPTQKTLGILQDATSDMQTVDPDIQQSSVRTLVDSARQTNTDEAFPGLVSTYKNVDDFLKDVETRLNFHNLRGSFRRQALEGYGISVDGSVDEQLSTRNPNIALTPNPGSLFDRVVFHFDSPKSKPEPEPTPKPTNRQRGLSSRAKTGFRAGGIEVE